jgi:drug/metabolite transporter superfamily protein YnfA
VRVLLGFLGFGALFFLWVAAISELVGLPLAWLKVRKTRTWRERPRHTRGIDLLESFIRPILWETGPVALAVLAFFGGLLWLLGLWDTGLAAAAYVLVFLVPAIMVGVAVSRLDPSAFEAEVAEQRADRSDQEAGSPPSGASHSGGNTGGILPG